MKSLEITYEQRNVTQYAKLAKAYIDHFKKNKEKTSAEACEIWWENLRILDAEDWDRQRFEMMTENYKP